MRLFDIVYYIIKIYKFIVYVMFVLIVFADLQRTSIVNILRFQKMKDIISLTNGKVNYYDVRRNQSSMKYVTQKSLFEVVKI